MTDRLVSSRTAGISPPSTQRHASESGGVVLSVFQRLVRLGYVQRLLRLGLTGWNIDMVMSVGRDRGRIRARPVPEGDRSVC